MSAQEPVSCPFCGSDSIALHPNDLAEDGGAMGLPGHGGFYAHCDGCGAEGPQCDDEESAILAWSRRAPLLAAQPVAQTGVPEGWRISVGSDGAVRIETPTTSTTPGLTIFPGIEMGVCERLLVELANALAASPAPTKQVGVPEETQLQYDNIFDAITTDAGEAADLKLRSDLKIWLRDYLMKKKFAWYPLPLSEFRYPHWHYTDHSAWLEWVEVIDTYWGDRLYRAIPK